MEDWPLDLWLARRRAATSEPCAAPLGECSAADPQDQVTLSRTDANAIVDRLTSMETRFISLEQNYSQLVDANGRLEQKCSRLADTNRRVLLRNDRLISHNEQLESRIQKLEGARTFSSPGNSASSSTASSGEFMGICQWPGISEAAETSPRHHDLVQQSAPYHGSSRVPESQPEAQHAGKQPEQHAAALNELPAIQRQMHRLELEIRRHDVIIHAPKASTHERVLADCSTSLRRADASAAPLRSSALRQIKTSRTDCTIWHLRLRDSETKHALFSRSRAFRDHGMFLSDHLTQQQLAGRRQLQAHRLHLKRQGYQTWWRQDVLYWSSDGVVHMQQP